MPTNNFITSLYNVLGDSEAYYDFQKEMVSKSIEEIYFNTFKGKTKFDAVVVSIDVGSVNSTTMQQAIRVRPLDIHDFILPEPCSPGMSGRAVKAVLSMHPIAYSIEIPTKITQTDGGSAKLLTNQIRVGDLVVCNFGDGPSNNGNLRQLFFEPFTRGTSETYNMDIKCLSTLGLAGTPPKAAQFAAGGYDNLNVTDVEIPESERQGIKGFIQKIKNSPSFRGWSGQALAGVVSNAKAESAFKQLAAGDPVTYYKQAFDKGRVSSKRMKNVQERSINNKCSWGYWQLNICPNDGSGRELAVSKGIDTTTKEGKKQWVQLMSSDEEQFSWVSGKMAKILTEGISGTSPYQAAYDITVEFERPVDKENKGAERGRQAEAIYKEFKDILG